MRYTVTQEGPVGVDAAPRGILKNGLHDQAAMDENCLFCNVPEHHDMVSDEPHVSVCLCVCLCVGDKSIG
ncbi:hypothetical protein ElyMa_001064900 [Elysia marginata]|uniref:Uncharacterized protein n=1 Tax=Elysia marginata TaxID=1093978 RepID=A0AAV4HPS4_9GAST|nr:hypothetical protein ElyMa_001064900 [Elysia marginata]